MQTLTFEQAVSLRAGALDWQGGRLSQAVALQDLPTPALVIDKNLLDKNLSKMAAYLSANNMALRAHGKMHKCPKIAHLQMQHGASGLCAAKVSEAEVFAAAGISSILITSPVMAADKVQRVAKLARQLDDLMIVVDNPAGATLLGDAAANQGVELTVLIDVDPNMGRTGLRGVDKALAVLAVIQNHPSLKFAGLQQYCGQVMHIKGWSERRAKSLELLQLGVQIKQAIEGAGVKVELFSGGGTGTFDIDTPDSALNELQAGSYVFMDAEYRQAGGQSGEVFDDFAPALSVLSSAISQPDTKLITFDAGYKSFASETVMPELHEYPSAQFFFAGDEHGMVKIAGVDQPPQLGQKHLFLTSHCDPTVNLYDFYWVMEDGFITELWPVSARGCSQ